MPETALSSPSVDRRTLLRGGAALAAAAGATPLLPGLAGSAVAARGPAAAAAAARKPLWQKAAACGVVFGSSIATWQLDKEYRKLHGQEAGLMFTEDDLLWYQLKPKPGAKLNFEPGDKIVEHAEKNDQLTIGAHLVWDEGFGEGWTDDDLWGISKKEAEKLLYGTIRKEVQHYAGRMNAWIVANEVTDPEFKNKHGFRKNVPWFNTIGPEYIGECFHIAEQEDPGALRIINEFGFETVNEWGDKPEVRRTTFLKALDRLLETGVPVQAVGIQGHLLAHKFHQRFDEEGYAKFLQEFVDRGLPILITEMDVLDEGLPKDKHKRDKKVADVYRHYLDVTLAQTEVKVVVAFGLTDRYTWLDEDQPREDGAHRRPLLFNRKLRPKPAYKAVSEAFANAPAREMLWELKKS